VENLMEFWDDGNESESDSESDKYSRRRKFRSSRKITPESIPEIQGLTGENFGKSPKVEETESEDENDEMGKPKSSSSSCVNLIGSDIT
jgi:hypothetical protein